MSCIPKILELKGEKDFLTISKSNGDGQMGIVVEDGGSYKGYDYLVTFNDMGFRCGYVAISPQHPVYQFQREEYNYPDLEVHGGVTFFEKSHIAEVILGTTCEDKWVGFDCGHAWDLTDIDCVDKYFPNLRDSRRDYAFENSVNRYCNDGVLRTKEYTIEQCKRLIDQLIEKEAA